MGKQLGFIVKEIPEQVINEVTISSTRIRESLLKAICKRPIVIWVIIIFLKEWWLMAINLEEHLVIQLQILLFMMKINLVPANGIYVAEAEIEEVSMVNGQSVNGRNVNMIHNSLFTITSTRNDEHWRAANG